MSESTTAAPATTETPAEQPSPRRAASGHSAWAMASVFIVLFLIVGIPLGYVAITWSKAVANAPQQLTSTISQAAAEAVRPKLTMNEVVVNSLQDLHKENKLVVFTADVSADVTREEGSSSWGVYWGTNVARVRVRDAHVNYVVDLSKLETSDFIFNDQAKVLSIFIPRPRIDNDMVAIDPAKIETLDLRGGWARFDKQDTRDNAIAELRPKAIIQAQAPFVKELAMNSGIDTTAHLLQPMADALNRDGVTLRVSYKTD